MLDFLIILLVSFFATALSSMSGGGASVITIPVLLWMGVPFPLAITAQKLAAIFWVLPAAYNYLKGRKVDWLFLTAFSAIGLFGVYIGVSVVVNTNQDILRLVIGTLILCLVAYTVLKRNIGLAEHVVRSKAKSFISYVFALILGFYEAIFGSGNGIMFSILTLKTRGFDFVDALGYYYAVVFPWEVFATALFVSKGYFSWEVMIPTVIGSIVGGYIGSKYAKYKGNKFIKIMFVIIGSILGLKLIIGL